RHHGRHQCADPAAGRHALVARLVAGPWRGAVAPDGGPPKGGRMRIAMISEHASPLAALGGQDAGGQNAHVAELSTALAADGHEVRVYTRRDATDLPETVSMCDGVDVVHVPAGPPEPMPKDELLPHMAAFGNWLAEQWQDGT